mmetsp:Transcript_19361/g.59771  ORF Transcript_19361/g.59771 Transcript_19361/m.59771 type:complete len:295 (+) Transcript_19361:204-1088(+)
MGAESKNKDAERKRSTQRRRKQRRRKEAKKDAKGRKLLGVGGGASDVLGSEVGDVVVGDVLEGVDELGLVGVFLEVLERVRQEAVVARGRELQGRGFHLGELRRGDLLESREKGREELGLRGIVVILGGERVVVVVVVAAAVGVAGQLAHGFAVEFVESVVVVVLAFLTEAQQCIDEIVDVLGVAVHVEGRQKPRVAVGQERREAVLLGVAELAVLGEALHEFPDLQHGDVVVSRRRVVVRVGSVVVLWSRRRLGVVVVVVVVVAVPEVVVVLVFLLTRRRSHDNEAREEAQRL